MYRKKPSNICKLSSLHFRHKTRKPIALQQVLANEKPRFRQNCLKNEVFSHVSVQHFRCKCFGLPMPTSPREIMQLSFASFDIHSSFLFQNHYHLLSKQSSRLLHSELLSIHYSRKKLFSDFPFVLLSRRNKPVPRPKQQALTGIRILT